MQHANDQKGIISAVSMGSGRQGWERRDNLVSATNHGCSRKNSYSKLSIAVMSYHILVPKRYCGVLLSVRLFLLFICARCFEPGGRGSFCTPSTHDGDSNPESVRSATIYDQSDPRMSTLVYLQITSQEYH
jgi:hypothetical protein